MRCADGVLDGEIAPVSHEGFLVVDDVGPVAELGDQLFDVAVLFCLRFL